MKFSGLLEESSNMYKLFFCVVLLAVSAKAFIIDDLLGSNGCQNDTGCNDGCCLFKTTVFGGKTGTCHSYLLPGAVCVDGDTHHCGCMKGYKCETVSLAGVAVETGTVVKGYCKPENGFTGGPQIAVEGGR